MIGMTEAVMAGLGILASGSLTEVAKQSTNHALKVVGDALSLRFGDTRESRELLMQLPEIKPDTPDAERLRGFLNGVDTTGDVKFNELLKALEKSIADAKSHYGNNSSAVFNTDRTTINHSGSGTSEVHIGNHYGDKIHNDNRRP
jgi:hypothetical protein